MDRLLSVLDEPTSVDPGLARAIGTLADEVNLGGRVTQIRLEWMEDGEPSRSALLDVRTRQAIERAANRPQPRSDTVHGSLVEADFENNRARLRLPTGEPVTVTFDDDLADEIKSALREPSVFAGDVSYDAATGRAQRIAVRRLLPPHQQLTLPGLDFQEHRTVVELAFEQGVHGPQRLDDLHTDDIDDELAAFVAAAEQS